MRRPPRASLITGSKHDFKTTAMSAGGTMKLAYNKCSTCHAAHKPKKIRRFGLATTHQYGLDGVERRGRTCPDGTMICTYLSADELPSGSGMCMSHDGVTAIETRRAERRDDGFDSTETGARLECMHPVGRKCPSTRPAGRGPADGQHRVGFHRRGRRRGRQFVRRLHELPLHAQEQRYERDDLARR